MSVGLERILEKQANRYRSLLRLYELTDGMRHRACSFRTIAKHVGLEQREADEAYLYLIEEHLIEPIGRGSVAITHLGIVEIEQPITKPDVGTKHFAISVIQHFHGTVGAVQNAPHSTSEVHQQIGTEFAKDLDRIKEFRAEIDRLAPTERSDATELLDALEDEVRSEHPNRAKLKAIVTALGSFLSNTASNVLAAILSRYV